MGFRTGQKTWFRVRTPAGPDGYFLFFVWVVILAALGVYLLRLPTFQVGAYMDDGLYITLAKSIAAGHGYARIDLIGAPATTVWHAGYSLLLAPLMVLFPNSYLPLQVLSVVLAGGSVYLFWLLTRRRWKSSFAILAVLLLAFNANFAMFASLVMSEVPAIFFSLLTLVLLDQCQPGSGRARWACLAMAAAAAMTFFIRIEGLALMAAVGAYLLLNRQFLRALEYGLEAGLFALPWMARNYALDGVLLSRAYHEAAVTLRLPDTLSNLRATLADYFSVLPHSLIPVLGPRSMPALGDISPALPVAFNLLVWVLVAVGFAASFRDRLGAANLYVLAAFAALVLFRGYGDDRYLLPLVPFLILYLLLGLRAILRWVAPAPGVRVRAAALVVPLVAVILLVNMFRNAQAVLNPVRQRMPDVSLGATWIRDHSSADAVVMARQPRVTFIYTGRPSISYPDPNGGFDTLESYGELPELAPAGGLEWAIDRFHVDYLLVAPPLKAGSAPYAPRLDDYTRAVVLPELQTQPDRFRLVYANPGQQVFVYQVGEKK